MCGTLLLNHWSPPLKTWTQRPPSLHCVTWKDEWKLFFHLHPSCFFILCHSLSCSPSRLEKHTDLKLVPWRPHTYWHCVSPPFAVSMETCTQNCLLAHAWANSQYPSMLPPICAASCSLCQCSTILCVCVCSIWTGEVDCACAWEWVSEWGYHRVLLCPSGNMNVGQCLCGTLKGNSSLPLNTHTYSHTHTDTLSIQSYFLHISV